ncbi:hypothetical protein ACFFLM_01260 [Deinococcus oregonensis]|uniref:Uncharacterized protein n=1 Tax=Deinococcus oregonensis TaxID=1805970 RepID=A0ABV6ASZ5_9DEIO
MGTDIYERWEIRQEGRWQEVELVPPFDWETATDEEEAVLFAHPAFLDRDYRLFAVLADVRNTFGVRPIAPPRGLPQDASATNRLHFAELHSYEFYGLSFVTLSELLAYDWQQIITDSRRIWLPPESLWTAAEPFTTITLPYLRTLVENTDDLRMIFTFD